MTHSTDALRLVPVSALEEVRDLLMERIHGNPARSAGHNARLALEAIIAAPASPLPEGGGGMERDEIARLIWQRFAPSSDMDEANALRGEYVLVADDIVALRKLPAAPTGDAK